MNLKAPPRWHSPWLSSNVIQRYYQQQCSLSWYWRVHFIFSRLLSWALQSIKHFQECFLTLIVVGFRAYCVAKITRTSATNRLCCDARSRIFTHQMCKPVVRDDPYIALKWPWHLFRWSLPYSEHSWGCAVLRCIRCQSYAAKRPLLHAKLETFRETLESVKDEDFSELTRVELAVNGIQGDVLFVVTKSQTLLVVNNM